MTFRLGGRCSKGYKALEVRRVFQGSGNHLWRRASFRSGTGLERVQRRPIGADRTGAALSQGHDQIPWQARPFRGVRF